MYKVLQHSHSADRQGYHHLWVLWHHADGHCAKGSENQDSEAVRLNKHYEQLLQKAKTYRDIKILTETAEEFDRLGEYENSRAMAEYCRKRADEEQARRNEEMEKRKIEAQWRRKGQRWYNIRMVLIGILIVALVIAITLFMNDYLSDKTWLLP